MPDDLRHTERKLPVLIGNDYKHLMATAQIVRSPNKVTIEIIAEGENGQALAAFLEEVEPIGLKFVAIPVRNILEKRER